MVPIKTLRPFLATVASVALAFAAVALSLPSAAAAAPQVFTPFALNNGFGTDAQTQRVITWMALNSAQYSAPYIKVSTDAAAVTDASPASCASAAAPAPMATYKVYTCALTGLLPGTTYSYAVGATQGADAVESPVYSFTTDNGQPFTFLDFADTQASAGQYDSYWGNDLRTALQRTPDAAFVAQNGDITDDGSATQIQDWLTAVGTSLAGPALNLVLGNHDGDNNTSATWATMTPRASLTNPNSYYNFGDNSALEYAYVYGNALFLMVNTNPSSISIAQLNAMATWIKDTVAQYGHNPDGSQRFVIVVEHKSPFGGIHSGASTYPAGDYGNPNIVQVLPKAYFEAGVDLVLAGHDHNLIRSLPVTWNYSTGKAQWNRSQIGLDTIDSTTDGLVYYVPSFAGAKNYSAVATSATVSPWIDVTKNYSVTPSNDAYSAVTVDATAIHVNTYIVGSTTPVDSFVITHPVAAPAPTVGDVSVTVSPNSALIIPADCGNPTTVSPTSVTATVAVADTTGAPMADQAVTLTADAPLTVPAGTFTTGSDGTVQVTLGIDPSSGGGAQSTDDTQSALVRAVASGVDGSAPVTVTWATLPQYVPPLLVVQASPTSGTSVLADGQQSYTVTVSWFNRCGSVADMPVVFSVDGHAVPSSTVMNTDSTGTASITVTDTTAETVSVGATVNSATYEPASLVFDPVPVVAQQVGTVGVSLDSSYVGFNSDPCAGTVTASPSSVTATITVMDTTGKPMADQSVTLTADAPLVVPSGTFTTGSDGMVQVMLGVDATATYGTTASVGAAVDGVTGSAPVTVVGPPLYMPPAPPSLSLTVTPNGADGQVLADGSQSWTVTVTLTNVCEREVNVPVQFTMGGNAQPPVSTVNTDSAGKASVTVTDSTAETVDVTAAVDGYQVSGPASLVFAPAPVVGAVSVAMSPDTVVLGPDASLCNPRTIATPSTVTATVTVTDTNGNLMANQSVAITADASLVAPTGLLVTGSDGTVQVTLGIDAAVATTVSSADVHAAVAGVDGAATVTFTLLGFMGAIPMVPPTLTASPTVGTTVLANGQDSYTVTATVADACGTRLADAPVNFRMVGDATLSAGTMNTDANGVASITVTDTTIETANVTATANGLTSSPVGLAFDPAPPLRPPTVSVSIDPPQLCVGATATVSAYVAGADGMPIPDVVVTFTATGWADVSPTATTGPDGVATAQVTDRVAENVVVTASFSGEQSSVNVAFVPGCTVPSAVVTAVTVSPVANTVDPSTWVEVGSSYTVTVTVKDSSDNLITGASSDVRFVPSSPDVKVSDVVDNGDGTYSAQLTSTVADSTGTVYAVFRGNATSDGTQPIPFRAGPVNPSPTDCSLANIPGFSVDKTELPVLGVATGNVFVVDKYCNPLPGIAVTFSQTVASNATILPETAVTGADGHAVATISDPAPETAAFSASLTDFPNVAVPGSPVDVMFTQACGDPVPSTFAVTPATNASDNSNWPVADGVTSYTGTVTARDGGCNGGQLLADLDPKDFTFTPSSSSVQVSEVVDNGDGTYSTRFTSRLAGADFTVTAQYQGMRIGNPSTTDVGLPIPFKAGAPIVDPIPETCSPMKVNLAVDPVELTVGQSATVTAFIPDCNLNPVPNEQATFTVSGDAVLSSSSATINSNGLATVTVTDTTAETVTISVTPPADASPLADGSITSVQVTFDPGPSSTGPFDCQPGQESTNVSASPMVVPSPGPSTLRAYVTDQYCNPVTGALVNFGVPLSSHATYFTTPGWGSGYTVNGVVYATLNDPVAETTQVWAATDGYYMATNPASGLFVTFSNGDGAPTMTFTVSYPRASNVEIADGKDAATGVVTVRDANNDLVTDLDPADFRFSPSSADVKVSDVTNNGDGTFSADFTSLVADSTVTVYASYQGVAIGSPEPTVRPIPFAPGNAVQGPYTCPDGRQGTHLAASSVMLAVGEITYVTAFITDANCNPTSGGLLEITATGSAQLPSGTSTYLWNGVGSIAVTDSMAETSVISARGSAGGGDVIMSGFTGSVNVTWGDSTVVPAASMAYDPATGYLTATVTDGSGTPLPNIAVVFTRPGSPYYTTPTIVQTDGNGQAKYWAMPLTPQLCATWAPFSVAATVVAPNGSLVNVGGSPMTIPPIQPSASFATSCKPGQLLFGVLPVVDGTDRSNWPVADGSSSYVVTVSITNLSVAPVNGKYPLSPGADTSQIIVTPSSPNVKVSLVNDNGDGTYSARLTATVADPNYTVSVTYGGNVATASDLTTTSLPIPYLAVPSPSASMTYDDSTRVATVTVLDGYGKPMSGATVTFSVSSGNPVTVPTGSDGVATAQFTIPAWTGGGCVIPPVLVSATVVTPDGATVPVSGSPAFASWSKPSSPPTPDTPGCEPVELSESFSIAPAVSMSDSSGWVVADGSTSYTGTVTVKDANDNPVNDLNPKDFTFSPSSTDVKVSDVTNNGDGTYSVKFTSTVANATTTVYANYQGAPIAGGIPLPIPFKAVVAFSAAKSEFSVVVVHEPLRWGCIQSPGSYVGTLTARDAEGNQLKNLDTSKIQFAASSPDVVTSAPVDAGDGTYTVTFTRAIGPGDPAQTATVSVSYDGSTKVADASGNTDVPVVFGVLCWDPPYQYAGDATLTYDPTTHAATVTVLGPGSGPGLGSPLPGATVTFTVSGATIDGMTSATVTTGDAGVVTVDVTPGMDACGGQESMNLSASATGPNGWLIAVDGSPVITTAPAVCAPAPPTVDVTNGSQVTGTGTSGDTIQVKDATGKVVPGCESTTVDSTGHFKCVPTTRIQPGNKLMVTQTDLSGASSAVTAVTVSTLRLLLALPSISLSGPLQQTVTGSNFNPGERVDLVIESTPWDIGYQTADSAGTVVFAFKVPANFPVGTHTATLTGSQSGAISNTFQVISPGNTTPVNTTPTITVATGGSVASSELGLAVGAVGAGFGGLAFLWAGIATYRRKEEAVE